jgi:hypothetical protein
MLLMAIPRMIEEAVVLTHLGIFLPRLRACVRRQICRLSFCVLCHRAGMGRVRHLESDTTTDITGHWMLNLGITSFTWRIDPFSIFSGWATSSPHALRRTRKTWISLDYPFLHYFVRRLRCERFTAPGDVERVPIQRNVR